MKLRFTDFPPGEYAVALFQDLDGDQTLATSLRGVPKEPWGMSNDPKLDRPAKWSDAGFTLPAEGITVVASKRHGDPERLNDFLKDKKVAALFNRSSSLKFCALASGQADYYPRLGPTSEWDTAAGEAILRAAGGTVTMVDGSPFLYGKADKKFLNPEFVAFIP